MKEHWGQPNTNGCSIIIVTLVIFIGFGLLWLLSPVFAIIAKYQVEINTAIMVLLLGLLIYLNSFGNKTNKKNSITNSTNVTQTKRDISSGRNRNPKPSIRPSNAITQRATTTESKRENIMEGQKNNLIIKQDQEVGIRNQLSTNISEEDWNNSIVDEFGARYDKNCTRLFQGPTSSMRAYQVKNGTKIICDKAFSNIFETQNLEELYLPETIVKIGFAAFHNCKKLKKIHLPLSLKEIGNDAFRNCVSIENIILPKHLTDIGNGAFSGCVCRLESKSTYFMVKANLLLSSNLKRLYHCRANAEYVIIPNTIEIIDNCAFSDCKHLVGVEIPSSVLSVGDYCFENCVKLNRVLFRENLQNIGFGAFAGCESLTQIMLPKSTMYIDDLAFSRCNNLCTVFFSNGIVKLGRDLFDEGKSLPCIFVPHDYYTKYQNLLSGYNNVIFKDDSCFSLSAFEAFFCVSHIVKKDAAYALVFDSSIMVYFDQEASEYLQANTNNSDNHKMNNLLIWIKVDREYITGFKAFVSLSNDSSL